MSCDFPRPKNISFSLGYEQIKNIILNIYGFIPVNIDNNIYNIIIYRIETDYCIKFNLNERVKIIQIINSIINCSK
jgi:hypothetical protein